MDRIRLSIKGISAQAMHSMAYVLELDEQDGKRRLPIVVGMPEAQAIAVAMSGIVTPRPMTHDLIVTLFHRFGIVPEYVDIHHFESGIFTTDIHLTGPDGTETVIDARASDAVAIALRANVPVYTNSTVMGLAAYVPEADNGDKPRGIPLVELPTERLKARLDQCVAEENYELAAEIQKIINSRQGEPKQQHEDK